MAAALLAVFATRAPAQDTKKTPAPKQAQVKQAPVATPDTAKKDTAKKDAATATPYKAAPAELPGLGGHCPVSYFQQETAVKGLPQHSFRYLGTTYHFASSENRAKFIADPAKYVPQYGGWCAMALGGPYNNMIEADPTVFKIVNSKLYLFSSERAKRACEAELTQVLGKADYSFSVPFLKGYCPVSYQTQRQPLKGDHLIRAVYRKRPYQFVSEKERALFIANPEQYLPRYDAYDPTALAAKKETSGELITFAVYRDRTYFFADDRTRQVFLASPRIVIERADDFWEKLHPPQE